MVFDIARFDPFAEISDLQQRMSRLLQEIGDRTRGEPAPARLWTPAVDVAETPESFIIRAELPGLRREEIDIEVSDGAVVVRGERKAPEPGDQLRFLRQERAYGPFQRTFDIGVPIQHDKVTASYKDGLLEVVVPKSEAVKPKKIEVSAEES